MSKGSGRRPQEADDKHVSSEWDRLFSKVVKRDIKKTFGKEVELVTYGSDERRQDKKDRTP